MYRIKFVVWTLTHRLRSDRGETGPLGYAVMVAAIVLIALAVAAWGGDVAEYFMDQVEGVDSPDIGEVGGGGGG